MKNHQPKTLRRGWYTYLYIIIIIIITMPQALIHLDFEHDKIISKYSKKWKLSKHDTILKIILDFKEGEKEDGNGSNN